MSTENWRPVVGHEKSYEVSDRGRVRSLSMTEQERDTGPVNAKGEDTSFLDSLQGFARMCESGALSLDDGQMLADKFRDAAAVIYMQQNIIRDYSGSPGPADLREVVAKAVNPWPSSAGAKGTCKWELGEDVKARVADDVLSALAAAGYVVVRPPQAGDGLGNGLVAVPKEPTEAMAIAGQLVPDGTGGCPPYWKSVYRSMLSAAKEGAQ